MQTIKHTAIITAIETGVGAVVGGTISGPAGAIIGAKVGAALALKIKEVVFDSPKKAPVVLRVKREVLEKLIANQEKTKSNTNVGVKV